MNSTTPPPSVAVIIVSYNSGKYLEECLHSLQQQTLFHTCLVVDNASIDESVEMAEKYGSRILLLEKNFGFAEAVNQGVAHLQGAYEYLILVNPDTILDKNCLKELVATSEREHGDIVQASIFLPGTNKVNTLGNVIHFTGVSYCPEFGEDVVSHHDVPIVASSGACMLIRRDSFEALEGLRSDFFMYMEDTDISWRALLSGRKVMLSSKARCLHDYYLKLPPWKLALLDRNRLAMIFSNYEVKTLLLLMPLLICFELALLLWSIPKGYFFKKIRGLIKIMSLFPTHMAYRRKNAKLRVLSDKNILALFEIELMVPGLRIPFIQVGNKIFQLYSKILLMFI